MMTIQNVSYTDQRQTDLSLRKFSKAAMDSVVQRSSLVSDLDNLNEGRNEKVGRKQTKMKTC